LRGTLGAMKATRSGKKAAEGLRASAGRGAPPPPPPAGGVASSASGGASAGLARGGQVAGKVAAVAKPLSRFVRPGVGAVSAALAGKEAAEYFADRQQNNALESYNTVEDANAFRDAQSAGYTINPEARTSMPEGFTPGKPTVWSGGLRSQSPNEQVGAPDGIDRDGQPFYKGPQAGKGRLKDAIGMTQGGSPIFQDGKGEFSDRGMNRNAFASDPRDNLANELDRIDEASFRNAELQDAREAASMGLSTEAWQAQKGTLGRGAARDAQRGLRAEGYGNLGDRIQVADFQRKALNDQFDQSVELADLSLKRDQVEEQRTRTDIAEEASTRAELNDISAGLSADDKTLRSQASGRAIEMIRADPDSPAARSVVQGVLRNADGTGFFDWLIQGNFFDGNAREPENLEDFLANFDESRGGIRHNDEWWADLDFSPEKLAVLRAYLDAKRGQGGQ
jgi:hypothetical protein